jgi:hypothetical protein
VSGSADNPDLAAALVRVIELLQEITTALARIEAQQERANELLSDLNRSQWA